MEQINTAMEMGVQDYVVKASVDLERVVAIARKYLHP